MHSFGPRRVGGCAVVLPVLLVLLSPAAPAADAQGLTVIKVAAYTPPQAPEGVWIDSANNKYVAMALTGEIQKISPDGVQSTIATMPLAAPPGDGLLRVPRHHRERLRGRPGKPVRRGALL